MRLVIQGNHLKFRNEDGKEGERLRFYAHDFTDILPVGTKMWVPKFDSEDKSEGNHVMVKLAGYEVNFGSDGKNPVTEVVLEVESPGDTNRVVLVKDPWTLRNSPID